MHERPARSMHTSIEHTDEDETKLFEVTKHPFGIFTLYFLIIVAVIVSIFLAYFLTPSVVTDLDMAFQYATVFSIVVIALAAMLIVLASIVYRQNRLIVTDRNITQILQFGLFHRKVSQLNMVNVEDVTSVQEGFLSTLFGFGSLNIETAGEQVNFHFTHCPRAGYYAKVILEAREKMLGQHDGDSSVDPGPSTTR